MTLCSTGMTILRAIRAPRTDLFFICTVAAVKWKLPWKIVTILREFCRSYFGSSIQVLQCIDDGRNGADKII